MNINLGMNIWTKKDGAFILRMYIPCGKTFLSVQNFYPLTSNLDRLWKKT